MRLLRHITAHNDVQMKIRIGELIHLLPKNTRVTQRMLRTWSENDVLRPEGGTEEKSRFWFDEKESAYALIAAQLHGFGVKGLGHQQAMLFMRTQFEQSGCNPIETATRMIKGQTATGPVFVTLIHVANTDDGSPLYSVNSESLSAPAACVLTLRLDLILQPLLQRF